MPFFHFKWQNIEHMVHLTSFCSSQRNGGKLHIFWRYKFHIDGRDNWDERRHLEHWLHRLEGRPAKGWCSKAREARLCQGLNSNNLEKIRECTRNTYSQLKLYNFQPVTQHNTSSPQVTNSAWDDVDCSNTMPAYACQKTLAWVSQMLVWTNKCREQSCLTLELVQ